MSTALGFMFLAVCAVFFYFASRYVMRVALIKPPSSEDFVRVISERQTLLNNAYLYLALAFVSLIVSCAFLL